MVEQQKKAVATLAVAIIVAGILCVMAVTMTWLTRPAHGAQVSTTTTLDTTTTSETTTTSSTVTTTTRAPRLGDMELLPVMIDPDGGIRLPTAPVPPGSQVFILILSPQQQERIRQERLIPLNEGGWLYMNGGTVTDVD